MTTQPTQIDTRFIKDQVEETVVQFFDPLLAAWRYLFEKRQYRVSYSLDSGMTMLNYDESFKAWNDRDAWKEAKKVAGPHATIEKVELYRVLKKT